MKLATISFTLSTRILCCTNAAVLQTSYRTITYINHALKRASIRVFSFSKQVEKHKKSVFSESSSTRRLTGVFSKKYSSRILFTFCGGFPYDINIIGLSRRRSFHLRPLRRSFLFLHCRGFNYPRLVWSFR